MRSGIAAALLLALLPPVALAQPGTQLTIAQPAEATTMDPGRSTQVLTVNYFYNLYDALTRWDAALKLQPGLATSWKQLTETTWEFTLRPGVKFHDGAPLTAEDVKATLERNLVAGKTVVQPGFATNGLLLGNPQSTLLDADGSLWRILHPNGFNGLYWVGSQPGQRFHDLMEQARYSLDARKRKQLYTEATQIIHEEKPSLELFQEVVVYGTSKRVSFKVRPDYRLMVSEMTLVK
jgi:ABC-type transport system substrate-binding protein